MQIKKREKKMSESEIIKILNAHATVTVHICTVTIVNCAFMHNFAPTDMSVFLLKMCKIS